MYHVDTLRQGLIGTYVYKLHASLNERLWSIGMVVIQPLNVVSTLNKIIRTSFLRYTSYQNSTKTYKQDVLPSLVPVRQLNFLKYQRLVLELSKSMYLSTAKKYM